MWERATNYTRELREYCDKTEPNTETRFWAMIIAYSVSAIVYAILAVAGEVRKSS